MAPLLADPYSPTILKWKRGVMGAFRNNWGRHRWGKCWLFESVFRILAKHPILGLLSNISFHLTPCQMAAKAESQSSTIQEKLANCVPF